MPPGTDADSGAGLAGRRVLLICTRDPRGRLSGRKMVLRTIIQSLAGLGLTLTVAYFGPSEGRDEDAAAGSPRFVGLPGPAPAERIANGLRWLLRGTPSLNHGLYRSRRAMAALTAIAREEACEIVVTDMLRTAPYAPPLGLPWIADLDDLLSRRYRTLAASYGTEANLLGYYRSPVGRALLRIGRGVMPWVLRREAAELQRQEIEVARSAQVTTLVSAAEAETLSRAAGRPVRSTPMAVAGPPGLPPLSGRPRELVFLGGLDYGPNLRCVLSFDREIRPRLEARGVADPKLHVIGVAPEGGVEMTDAVTLEGYVEDLDAAMQQYRAMLVPEVPPGGVKTKIIVAALNGTVVLAHRTALDGMDLRSGVEVWAWDDTTELADLLLRLQKGELDLAGTARAARAWAEARFSPEVLTELWRRNLRNALPAAPPGPEASTQGAPLAASGPAERRS